MIPAKPGRGADGEELHPNLEYLIIAVRLRVFLRVFPQNQESNLLNQEGKEQVRRILPTGKKLGYDAKMKRIIHVRIFRGEKYFVAECFDLPVVTQAATLDELMKNVKEAIALQLEGEDPADFGLARDASILASYELEPEPQAHAEA